MVNEDCSGSGNNVCVMGKCKPPASGRVVAFSITPPGSSTAAQTELSNYVLTGQPVTLMLDNKGTISATVMSETTFFPREAHVQVTIPSRIPGQAPLQVGTEMANNMFTFSLAQARIGMDTMASFLFTPGTTAQDRPPVLVSSSLAAAITLTFPAKTELIAVNGLIVDPNGTPLAGEGHRAQLSHERSLVSNVIAPDAMGMFRLLVPPKGQLDTNDLVTLTIGTADNPLNEPQFVSSPEISLDTLAAETKDRPRTFVMPAHLPATMASLHVTGNGRDQAGVTVRFRTEIDAPPYGKAVYQRTAMTDALGLVSVPLIPAAPGAPPLLYQISLQGPADDTYRFASQCVPAVPVVLDETETLQPLPPIDLQPKLSLSGSVRDSTEAPVMGARVTATQITPPASCPNIDPLGSNPVSAPTDAMGNYNLYVDPGTYRIDVMPPPNSVWPRKTEDGTNALKISYNRVHPIDLPPGEAVEGIVVASDGQTLMPDTKVSILAVFCQSAPCSPSTPAEELAEATTDLAGHFKAIIPAP